MPLYDIGLSTPQSVRLQTKRDLGKLEISTAFLCTYHCPFQWTCSKCQIDWQKALSAVTLNDGPHQVEDTIATPFMPEVYQAMYSGYIPHWERAPHMICCLHHIWDNLLIDWLSSVALCLSPVRQFWNPYTVKWLFIIPLFRHVVKIRIVSQHYWDICYVPSMYPPYSCSTSRSESFY